MMDIIQSEDLDILDKSKVEYITINPQPLFWGIIDECADKLLNR